MLGSLLGRLEERQAAAHAEIHRLGEQIGDLQDRLSAAKDALTRLQITQETLLSLAAEDEPAGHSGDPVLDSPAYRQVLAVLETSDTPLRAKDLCQTLRTGTEPKNIEGMRAKLKRLVGRGILTEPQPGQFTLKHQDKT